MPQTCVVQNDTSFGVPCETDNCIYSLITVIFELLFAVCTV